MFCEITIDHRSRIEGSRLAEILSKASPTNMLAVADAYARSEVYKDEEDHPGIAAFEAGQHCFAILQKVDRRQSTLHFEAEPPTSVQTLLEQVEVYCNGLLGDLAWRRAPWAYGASSIAVRPFENNFSESGFEGNLATVRQSFKDTNFTHEIATKVVTLATTFLLVRFGLTQETSKAALVTFLIAGAFAFVEQFVKWYNLRGKMSWRRR